MIIIEIVMYFLNRMNFSCDPVKERISELDSSTG